MPTKIKFTSSETKQLNRLINEEIRFKTQEQQSRMERMVRAFHIGRLLHAKIAHTEEIYGDEVVKLFAKQFKTSAQAGYDYLHFFRGALHDEKNIRNHPNLSREYFQALGTHKWKDDILRETIGLNFISNPAYQGIEGKLKPNTNAIDSADTILTFYYNTIKNMGMVYFITKVIFDLDDKGRYIWRFPAPKKGDEQKAYKVARLIACCFDDIRVVAGWKHRFGLRATWNGCIAKPTISAHKITYPDELTPQGIIFERRKDLHIREGLEQSSPFSHQVVENKVMKGDCRKVLLNKKLFPPRCIDLVVTDPPFGNEAYNIGWSPYSAIKHRADKTVKEQAEEVADVARIILKNKLNKERFAWYSFLPLNYVHQVIPPLIQAFQETQGNDFRFELLIWQKQQSYKIRSDAQYVHLLEGIAYITIGKALDVKTADGKKAGYASPLFTHPVTLGQNNYFWKPVSLLRELVGHSTYDSEDKLQQQQQCVLDPYAGRGSLGVACIELGRDFRLIEIDDDQYRHCKSEINRALKKLEKHG